MTNQNKAPMGLNERQINSTFVFLVKMRFKFGFLGGIEFLKVCEGKKFYFWGCKISDFVSQIFSEGVGEMWTH